MEFVQRERFLTTFPASMTAAEFVDKLDQNAGGVLTADERTQFIASLGATPSDVAVAFRHKAGRGQDSKLSPTRF